MSTILITGGSGMIGMALTKALIAGGRSVRHLSRTSPAIPEHGAAPSVGALASAISVRTFTWDPSAGRIDPSALEGVYTIVHLSGATVIGSRWTNARLKVIDASRAGAARLLHRMVRERGVPLKAFISASGCGLYGARTDDRFHAEDEPAATDTIGGITRHWEEAADLYADRCRVVKLRTPIVLAREGGALPRLAGPLRWGPLAPLGTGGQFWPWIHIDDLVRTYVKAIDDADMRGSYNVCAAEQPDHRTFMRELAHTLRRPFLPFGVPAWALRLAMGVQADLLLEGSRCATERAKDAGIRFEHAELGSALRNLLQ